MGKIHLSCTQEVQVDQTLPIGGIGNPCSMDHPKDQPLCLVLDSQGVGINPLKITTGQRQARDIGMDQGFRLRQVHLEAGWLG